MRAARRRLVRTRHFFKPILICDPLRQGAQISKQGVHVFLDGFRDTVFLRRVNKPQGYQPAGNTAGR